MPSLFGVVAFPGRLEYVEAKVHDFLNDLIAFAAGSFPIRGYCKPRGVPAREFGRVFWQIVKPPHAVRPAHDHAQVALPVAPAPIRKRSRQPVRCQDVFPAKVAAVQHGALRHGFEDISVKREQVRKP